VKGKVAMATFLLMDMRLVDGIKLFELAGGIKPVITFRVQQENALM